LKVLEDLGLGYMQIGQPTHTLSGGESQRIKLATELVKRQKSSNLLYVFDEPTTGLNISDISKLLVCLNRLVDSGNTVLVVEHNMDVIKTSDYVIDLGPEGGKNGGYLVAAGTPEEVSSVEKSYTGQYLAKYLKEII
jgi:excinuclease ABC subunit A